MPKEICLKIANVRMKGKKVQFQVEADASDEKEGTWLPCSQEKDGLPNLELYKMVLKALQDGRKTSGMLTGSEDSKELEISQVCVQYQ